MIQTSRDNRGTLEKLMFLITLNYFSIKKQLSYIKSLKTYVGKPKYLLYSRFDRYKFWRDLLQQLMLGFEKLFFTQLNAAKALLKYIENSIKIICLMTVRAFTIKYYICSHPSG